jgi:hypothetical protein
MTLLFSYLKNLVLYCYCSWVGEWEILFEYPNGFLEEHHLYSGI